MRELSDCCSAPITERISQEERYPICSKCHARVKTIEEKARDINRLSDEFRNKLKKSNYGMDRNKYQ